MLPKEIEDCIQELSPGVKRGDRDWDAPAFLLSIVHLPDCHPAKIAKFTGIDIDRVKEYLSRAKEQKILQQKWSKGKYMIHANWQDEKEGWMAFILDVLTVQGMVERCDKKD